VFIPAADETPSTEVIIRNMAVITIRIFFTVCVLPGYLGQFDHF